MVVSVFILAYVVWMAFPYSKSALDFHGELVVRDRNGLQLARFSGPDGGYQVPIALNQCPKTLIDLLLFSEDRKFYHHLGISVEGIARVFRDIFLGRGIRSGGSTLTQQLVKIRSGVQKNNLWTKFLEIQKALKLERHFSKDQILSAYINRVYLGNRIYGFEAASRRYFKKELWQTSLLEQAALVKLLQRPSWYNPYTHVSRLEIVAKKFLSRYKNFILQNSFKNSISVQDLKIALQDRLQIALPESEWWAPQFTLTVRKRIQNKYPQARSVRTTLDLPLYKLILQTAKNRVDQIRYNPGIQVSALMIDNTTGEILVYLGSTDFKAEDGQIDGVRMKRQPGSTMKPFVYSLALEEKRVTPASILPDIPTEFPAPVGKYIPKNYDRRFHGPVRMAVALASSYNVPAIWMIHQNGLYNTYLFLKNIGFESLKRPARFYGLGLALGNADVSLFEMVRAYTIFPRGGRVVEPRFIKDVVQDGRGYRWTNHSKRKYQSLSPETSALISHILSDFSYKVPAFGVNSPIRFPFPVAVKTGTSKNFRDNTVFAFTPRFTLGIWLGTFSGKALRKMPSSLGAGVILRDVLLQIYNLHPDWFPAFNTLNLNLTKRRICALSGKLAGPDCPAVTEMFIRGTEPQQTCDWHQNGSVHFPSIYQEWARQHYFKTSGNNAPTLTQPQGDLEHLILSPHQGDTFRIDPSVDRSHQAIELRSALDGGVWRINGKEKGRGRSLIWEIEPGHQVIRYELPNGRSEAVSVFVVE